MGVIKGNGDLFGAVNEMEYKLEPASSSASQSEDEEVVRRTQKKLSRTKPRARDLSICEAVARRRPGSKNARRFDNLRDLITMVEREDMEMDFSIFEPTVSAFAELLSEKEKMETWNNFVNASEEEQLKILQGGSRKQECPQDIDSDTVTTPCDTDSCGSDIDDGWVPVRDRRTTHPSFSAEECFQRLDKNIRTMLKRRQRPMGMLVSLEQEIVSFFKEWPTSVYISKLSSSYERMMLHALCQYLELVSKSFDSSGVRQTQVENPKPSFIQPPVLLTQYLEASKSL